jgi:hypothetical protein
VFLVLVRMLMVVGMRMLVTMLMFVFMFSFHNKSSSLIQTFYIEFITSKQKSHESRHLLVATFMAFYISNSSSAT